MQNLSAAPSGALIDPTRPDPPARAVLLGPDGAVLSRTDRTPFTQGRMMRLGPDGHPDPGLPAVEFGAGHMTMVTRPDPDEERLACVPPLCSDQARTATVTFGRVTPAAMALVVGLTVVRS